MERTRWLLTAIAVGLLVLSALFVLPFLEFFLLAVLLAFILRPVHVRIQSRTGPRVAAALVVTATTVAVIIPLAVVVRSTLSEAASLVAEVREGGTTLAELEGRILALTGMEVDLASALQSVLRQIGTGAVNNVIGVFGTVTHLLIGIGLTLFLLYYFLKDFEDFRRWLRATMPLPDRVQDELYGEIIDITWAVLAGHVLVAVIQGLVAGVGLVAVGVPNAVFWTVVMIVLAVLPVIGSFLVWGPAAAWLFLQNEPVLAALLFVYGTVIVGLSDDYLRPVIVDRYARLNPSVIIIGILGGIYVMGFMGIFFGPILIGALRATLDVYRKEYLADEPTGDEPADSDGPAGRSRDASGGDPRAEGSRGAPEDDGSPE